MGTNPARYLLPLLLILPINGTELGENGASSEAREPKSSRRVVRLYSGTRPIPIVCAGEGFQADPNDCSVFHRCMKNGNGRYLSFRFQCGPGTIYDPEAEICNHPERTKRSDCGRNKPIHIPDIEFPFDNDINREVPSPISTIHPVNKQSTSNLYLQTTHRADVSTLATKNPWAFTSHQYFQSSSNPFESPTKRQDLKTTKTPPTKRHVGDSFSESITPSWMSLGNTRFTTPRLINRQTTFQAGDICTSDGFIGDSENCRKFYRCINNQRGGFIRYEFMCNEPTVWDDEKQSCNHAWAVKRRRCGRGSLIDKSEDVMNKKETKEPTVHSVSNVDTTQNQLQINYGSKVTQIQTQISNGSTTQNQTQINYGQGVPNTTNPSILQNQTQISHGNAISQTQTQINYGDKAVQTQVQIDHSKESSQSQTQISEPTSTTRTTQHQQPQVSSSSNTNNVCTESGFMGDSQDCKKFYRCVDNGKGGFTRYEFTCGEGTVWDSQIEACNHAWAVKECRGKAPQVATTQSTTKITESSSKPTVSSSMSTMSTTTTTQTYYSPTEEETEEDNNDIPYGNQPPSSAPSEPAQHETMTTKAPQNVNDNNCKSSGFMGDTSDCKKFYRCVDNGNGGFTRYEFSCGEGTVWDEKIQSCNHPWAVENCGKNTGTSSTTSSVQTTSTQITSQIPPQNDDYDTGYGSQHDEPLSSSTTVTTSTMKSSTTMSQIPPQLSGTNTGNDCTSSGFMGDSNDCKKFYRCVDNGNGGYTKYEFSCGEGTVWDPKIQACNHAWAVDKCGGNSVEDINKVETTTQKESTSSVMSSSSTPILEPDDIDGGYEQPSNEPQPGTTASDRPQDMSSNQCKSSGFMGDSNDCKKFYRCVDNGDGTFTRYEFSCGDGTVWDTNIQACNHVWAVEKCGDASSQPISSTTQISSTSHEIGPDDQGQQTTQKTSTSASATSKPSDNKCTQEGFYGDKNNCKNFYRCVDNGQGGFTKYEFTCGEGTIWVQDIQACDHEAPDEKCSQHNSGTTSSKPNVENDEMLSEPTTTQSTAHSTTNSENNDSSQKPQSSNDKCVNEGFYGNSNDCKKFYRCVDDGKGGFTKYDFTCGDGTIWDQEILACNHETSDKNCKSTGSTSTTASSPETGSTEISTTSQEPNSETTRSPDETSSSSDKCESEGFFANSNNCKKFYRCVSNGKGGYTKYDFTCGEGTVWVQEILACDYDNDISSCSSKNNSSTPQTTQEQQSTTTEFTSTGTSDSQSQPPYKEDDEYQNTNGQENENKPGNNEESSENTSTTKNDTSTESSNPSNTDKCEKEGYFGDTRDCTKFYRCVDNGKGGLTKYDFTCGEGTIWDQDITTCNHPQDVANPSCTNGDNTQTTSNNSSSTGDSGTSSSSTTQNSQSTTESSSGGTSNCSQESTSKKPTNQKVKCEKAGFYADPDDCKKFYRCVDWDGDGQKFSVFHFDCGEGTIWDPQLDTCNHEDSVYPPRDCSGTQSQNMTQETTTTEQSTTTQDNSTTESTTTTTEESTTAEQTSSSEQTTQQTSTTEKTSTTTEQSSSEQTTQQSSTTTEQNTTEQQEQTTQESTTSQQTTQQSSSSEQTTMQQTTTEKSTTQESTTSEQTTTKQSTTTEQTTTQQTTTNEQTTSQQSTTTELTTTQQTTTNEQTTSQQSTTSSELTTQQTSSSEQTTQQSSNTDETTTESTSTSTTEQSTTESTTEQENSTTESSSTTSTTTESSTTTTTEGSTATTTENSTTTSESSEGTTTESDQGTTEQETSPSEKECPETDDDQYMYVCPTSFRRHPKYCNMFYQCTEDDDSHEVKVANFKCPNNTIYDESKTQCVEEDKADKKCDGQIARKYRVKRRNTNYKEPIEVGSYKHTCTAEGNYPFEKDIECSGAFLKCQKTKSGKLRGYVHRCPDGYTFWSISKRCEKKENMKDCKQSVNIWKDRWEIPMERKNIAK